MASAALVDLFREWKTLRLYLLDWAFDAFDLALMKLYALVHHWRFRPTTRHYAYHFLLPQLAANVAALDRIERRLLNARYSLFRNPRDADRHRLLLVDALHDAYSLLGFAGLAF